MKNITIIGTSHIAKESVEAVKKYIEEKKTDIVAVELDKKRFYGLVKKKKSRIRFSDLRRIGVKGYLFALIGAYVSKKLGEIVKSMPGDEMLAAIKPAKKNNMKIVLIDRDIEITLARFSRFLTWKEKWRFVVDLFNGLIFRKKENINAFL